MIAKDLLGRWLIAAVAAGAGAAAGALFIGPAGAEGIPSAPTLQYSGTLIDNGQPVTGTRTVTLTIWDAASGGTPVCSTTETMSVIGGRFQIVLPDDCLRQVRGNPNLWIEASVPPVAFPRRKLGAAPYAVEAERAATVGAAVQSQLVPAGAVMAFDLPACPPGWIAYEGAQGRAVVGVNDGSNGLAARKLGEQAGAESHLLSADELPPHRHSGTTTSGNPMNYRTVGVLGTDTRNNHVSGWSGTANFVESNDANYAMSAHTHNFVTDTGAVGNKPHSILPPEVALLYCKKT
jgi:microcystin-dependent protein